MVANYPSNWVIWHFANQIPYFRSFTWIFVIPLNPISTVWIQVEVTLVLMSTVPCSNTNMTMWYEFLTLQWRHMSVMVCQVMVNSTALSTGCWGPAKKTSKLSTYIWSNSLRMVMFYNCFQQYNHNYVTGIYHMTVTSLFVLNPHLLDCCFNSLLRLATHNITVSCILHKIPNLDGRILEITSDIDILLSTTQTKYDIGMVCCSDVTTLSQFLESPAPRLLFQQLV